MHVSCDSLDYKSVTKLTAGRKHEARIEAHSFKMKLIGCPQIAAACRVMRQQTGARWGCN